jgi:hypothetical protein
MSVVVARVCGCKLDVVRLRRQLHLEFLRSAAFSFVANLNCSVFCPHPTHVNVRPEKLPEKRHNPSLLPDPRRTAEDQMGKGISRSNSRKKNIRVWMNHQIAKPQWPMFVDPQRHFGGH